MCGDCDKAECTYVLGMVSMGVGIIERVLR